MLLVAALLQRPATVKPPHLINRAEIEKLKRDVERKYLQPHDSVLIHVNALIDTAGRVRDPYAMDSKDAKLGAVAALFVQRMRFTPATKNGKPITTILKVPVVFVR